MPPTQYSTATGTLTGAVDGSNDQYAFSPAEPAVAGMLHLNGLLMTQPLDGVTGGESVTMAAAQTPQSTDVVTVEAFVPDSVGGVNPPKQYSSVDGSISGVMNGVNNIFTLAFPLSILGNGTTVTVTQVMLYWNGLFMSPGIDYLLFGNQINMIKNQFPNAGDILTAQAFFQ